MTPAGAVRGRSRQVPEGADLLAISGGQDHPLVAVGRYQSHASAAGLVQARLEHDRLTRVRVLYTDRQHSGHVVDPKADLEVSHLLGPVAPSVGDQLADDQQDVPLDVLTEVPLRHRGAGIRPGQPGGTVVSGQSQQLHRIPLLIGMLTGGEHALRQGGSGRYRPERHAVPLRSVGAHAGAKPDR